MRIPILFSLVVLTLCLAVGAFRGAEEAGSAVPGWNQRGIGPLPWQGISCLDVRDDGAVLVGTIAPPGDPNVFVIDAEGKISSRHVVGQRWIGEVSFGGGGAPYAICTTPEGRANDFPTIYRCSDDVTPVRSGLGEGAYPQTIFQYGEHSNHGGTHLSRTAEGVAAVYGNRVLWLGQGGSEPRRQAQFSWTDEMVTVSMAAHRSGAVVVGCASPGGERKTGQSNLFLFRSADGKLDWERAPLTEVDEVPPTERGIYGTPQLPEGECEELPQEDRRVYAPLSLAFNTDEPLSLIAAADYPGWQRWIRSSATGRMQNYGTRMRPARPTVTVYDEQGKIVRRWGPASFAKPAWVDLVFLPGNRQLLAFPHQWACRGLAGQTVLPADGEEGDTLWLLDLPTGKVSPVTFPDAIAGVAVGRRGQVGVSCWNGRFYVFGPGQLEKAEIPSGTNLGGPALVRSRPAGEGFVTADAQGVVCVLDSKGALVRQIDLHQEVVGVQKPWVVNARAEEIAVGLWQLPGGRVESDLGGQRVIEAPDGLILIEGHAGLSFEAEWSAMERAGLDPRQVKYVLATHKHGDHAPGAYLWRVVTGARVVGSPEMAYALQHHVPLCSGYGLHPPVAIDLTVAEDTTLDLAGLPVRAVRVPGHTYGSMAYLFTKGGKRFAAIGDLIMPDGLLGYAGTINFSGRDVLASLRKLDGMKIDLILAGHGPTAGPERYLAAGIEVGRKAGWGKIRPEAPDPRFRLSQKNVLVVGWDMHTCSADFGDFNGDGRPDVAILLQEGKGSAVRIFLNRGGSFGARADHEFSLPEVADPFRVRVRHLNDDGVPDLLVGGRGSAILFSRGEFPEYETMALSLDEGNQARTVDLDGDEVPEVLVNRRFGAFECLAKGEKDQWDLRQAEPRIEGAYPDVWTGDLNGDGRSDLVSSYGQVFVRETTGLFPKDPTQVLPLADPGAWSFFGIGDFDGDGREDVALASYPDDKAAIALYRNSGEGDRPFAESPDAVLRLNEHPSRTLQSKPLLRDSLPVADWNGDGVDDLIVGRGQDQQVLVLFGGEAGLNLERSTGLPLDYRLYYEAGLHVDDFNGDGKADVAGLGYVNTGKILAAYIYLQVDQPANR